MPSKGVFFTGKVGSMGKKPVLWVSGVLLGSLGLIGCESPNKNSNGMAGVNGRMGTPTVTYGQPGGGQPMVGGRPAFNNMAPGGTVGSGGMMTPSGTFAPGTTGQPTGMYNPATSGKTTYGGAQGMATPGATAYPSGTSGFQAAQGYTPAQGYPPTQGAAAPNYGGVTQAGFQKTTTQPPIDPATPPMGNTEVRRTIPTYGTSPIAPPSPPSPPAPIYENP